MSQAPGGVPVEVAVVVPGERVLSWIGIFVAAIACMGLVWVMLLLMPLWQAVYTFIAVGLYQHDWIIANGFEVWCANNTPKNSWWWPSQFAPRSPPMCIPEYLIAQGVTLDKWCTEMLTHWVLTPVRLIESVPRILFGMAGVSLGGIGITVFMWFMLFWLIATGVYTIIGWVLSMMSPYVVRIFTAPKNLCSRLVGHLWSFIQIRAPVKTS